MHDAHVKTLIASLPERISRYYIYYEHICSVWQKNLLQQVQWARNSGFLSDTSYWQAVQNSIIKSGIRQCDQFFNLKKLYPGVRITIFQTLSPYTLGYAVLYGSRPKGIKRGQWSELEKIIAQESEIFLSRVQHFVTETITYLDKKEQNSRDEKHENVSKITQYRGFCEAHCECFDSH